MLFTTNLLLLLLFLLCCICSEFVLSIVWFQATSASLEAYLYVLHLLFDLLFECLSTNMLCVSITLVCMAFYTRALLCICLHLAQSFAVYVISIATLRSVCMHAQFCRNVLHAAVKACLKMQQHLIA